LDLPYIHYLVAFLNIGMIGAVIASIGLRFSFSSISLEGKYFWILLTSPFKRKNILIQKYLENYIPVAIIGVILVVVSNMILKPPLLINILSVVTILISTVTITSIGIGMGAIYPKFEAVNPAQVESSWGGIMYMIYCFIYIGVTLAAEAIWVKMHFLKMLKGLPVNYNLVGLIIFLILSINIIINLIFLKKGINKITTLEFIV
jgi:ABC-2 type transport system permease protein